MLKQCVSTFVDRAFCCLCDKLVSAVKKFSLLYKEIG